MSAAPDLPLIPREILFGNPEKASPIISPDGRHLAYVAPDDGVLNVWVRSLPSGEARCITSDRNRGIRTFLWACDSRQVLYLQDTGGDENWHIWLAHIEAKTSVDLTPFPGVQAGVVGLSRRRPGHALVTMNRRDARYHDVHLLDLATGEMTVVEENPGDVVGWYADEDFRVLACQASLDDGGFVLRVRDDVGAGWREVMTWPPDDEGYVIKLSPDGRLAYLSTTLGSNTQELRVYDIAAASERTLASATSDLEDVVFHPETEEPQLAVFCPHRSEWQVLDPGIQPDLDLLRSRLPGDVSITARDLADRTWIVLSLCDDRSASYHAYTRANGELVHLLSTRPALDEWTLAPMLPVIVPARDGLQLPAYLTLPVGHAAPGPLVLDVHGGPWARDQWGFDPVAQWLANRGYACLQVNYRGSTGFGKEFLHAGDREWGGKMHDDLIDSVEWAIAGGYADRGRVGIFGGSYGGYAALVGAAFTPDVFACAVDIVGPSSIRTLLASIPPYWEPLRRLFTLRVGDPETEPEFLDSRSPLYRASQIECPLLIAQGANDPRVKQAESEQIVAELRSRGKQVEYMLFDDEGHGFARPENRLRFYAAAERFLARHLGGRAAE